MHNSNISKLQIFSVIFIFFFGTAKPGKNIRSFPFARSAGLRAVFALFPCGAASRLLGFRSPPFGVLSLCPGFRLGSLRSNPGSLCSPLSGGPSASVRFASLPALVRSRAPCPRVSPVFSRLALSTAWAIKTFFTS